MSIPRRQSDELLPDSAELALSHPDPVPCEESPPNYFFNAPLVPMSPGQNTRYTRISLVVPELIKIPRGLHSTLLSPEPQYLDVGWVPHFNPEGTQYYVNESKHLVTDDPIYQPEICSKISTWMQKMDVLIETDGMVLPDDYEIFVTVAAENDGCRYYFVDHATQTVFWLEEIDPERHHLELAPVCSVAHMRFVLQEQYWIHNEYFPHRQVPPKLRTELVDIFRQGRADQLTSADSTFPYSAQQCKHYLEIIDVDTERNAYMTWTLARLWGTISRHKYSTFFGEDYAKISREQRRFDRPQTERTLTVKLCSALLFQMPKTRAAELDLLSVDDLTYAMHWREFAMQLLHGWKESTYLATGLAAIGSISTLQRTNPISACMGTISVVFALSGLSSGVMLLQWYSGAEKFSASMVADHLSRLQTPRHGYEPIAQAYCLPRALTFWSLIFLAVHVLSAVVDVYGLIVQSPAILFGLLLIAGLGHVNCTLRGAFDNATVENPSDAPVGTSGFLDGARSFLRQLGQALPKALQSSQSMRT